MFEHPKLDYGLVDRAIQHYASLKYIYIDVPWVVSKKAVSITCPINGEVNENTIVASGEQSFLELILNGEIEEGKYCCATPCYRPYDEEVSNYHFSQFFKVELIHYLGDNVIQQEYDDLVYDALHFMDKHSYFSLTTVKTLDDTRYGCDTLYSCDILRTRDSLELGSYGIRYNSEIGFWVFGTGIAVPRFQMR